MKRKFKTVMSTIPPISTNSPNKRLPLTPNQRRQQRPCHMPMEIMVLAWHGTGTKMWRG